MPSARVLSPHSSTRPRSQASENFAGAEADLTPSAISLSEPRLRKTRNVLLLGFGVTIGLLVLGGLNALAILSQLQSNNETILRDFLQEQQQLDQVRSAIYLSGTYLRDYLLEPDPEKAEQSRKALAAERAQASSILSRRDLLSGSPAKNDMHAALEREIADYWRSMDPA